MKTKSQSQVALVNARQELKDALERVKELRMKVANFRLDAAAERASNRAARLAARDQRRAERIAAVEARLLKLKSPKQTRKNYRKASEAVVYTAEQIAAMNAERGLV